MNMKEERNQTVASSETSKRSGFRGAFVYVEGKQISRVNAPKLHFSSL